MKADRLSRDDIEADAGITPLEMGRPVVTDKRSSPPQDHTAELSLIPSHLSHHDLQPTVSEHVEADEAQYTRFSSHRKVIITATLSLASFLAPVSSTSILSAIPEVAREFHSTGSIVNLSNALYMRFMGFSPCVWGPLSQVYGRRWVRNVDCVQRWKSSTKQETRSA